MHIEDEEISQMFVISLNILSSNAFIFTADFAQDFLFHLPFVPRGHFDPIAEEKDRKQQSDNVQNLVEYSFKKFN